MKRSRVVEVACGLAVGLMVALVPGTATADEAPRSDASSTTDAVTPTDIEEAIAYGQAQVGVSLYTGCWGGEWRMGATTDVERSFDGRNCGQSFINVLRPGWKGFDCSGLVYRMWEAAGVSFPYTSSRDMTAVPEIPMDQIQRGDLLLKPGSHVAVYLGMAEGTHWALEASPKTVLEQDGIWRVAEGVMAVDAGPYMTDPAYSARRVQG